MPFGRCLTFTQHVWEKPNTLVYLHLGAFFHTCLDFDTYVWEKAHMCDKNHTIICLQMFGIFHTCVGKATDLHFPLSYRWPIVNAVQCWFLITGIWKFEHRGIKKDLLSSFWSKKPLWGPQPLNMDSRKLLILGKVIQGLFIIDTFGGIGTKGGRQQIHGFFLRTFP